MNRKKSLVGIGLIAALMALTGWLLFRDQPVTPAAGAGGKAPPYDFPHALHLAQLLVAAEGGLYRLDGGGAEAPLLQGGHPAGEMRTNVIADFRIYRCGAPHEFAVMCGHSLPEVQI